MEGGKREEEGREGGREEVEECWDIGNNNSTYV